MLRILRDPLVHFILLAGLAFAGYGLLSGVRAGKAGRIVVTGAEQARMAALYAAETGTRPAAADMQAMIADHVEQQVLAREARRLGMDEGDTVIERRLTQKMMFMIADLSVPDLPGELELQSWFAANAARFERPARISFQHVFFADAADSRVEMLARDPSVLSDWRRAGDPFMLQREYADLSGPELRRLFGHNFSTAVMALAAGAVQDNDKWSGPVESAFGTHFIRVRKASSAYTPPMSEIYAEVESMWLEQARRRKTQEAIDRLISRYDVQTSPN